MAGHQAISCIESPITICANESNFFLKSVKDCNPTVNQTIYVELNFSLTGSTIAKGTELEGVTFNTGTKRAFCEAVDIIGNTLYCDFDLTVIKPPVITKQPIDQLDCDGAIAGFTVETDSIYTCVWQRKLPSETDFTNIPIEEDISYPRLYEIRLANVGSALSPDGTQYRVLLTDENDYTIISNHVTLRVNSITAILPNTTNVLKCEGETYSYSVSTSYPSNAISYQWKRSVTSGIWTDVADGEHFEGSKTSTLNIINGTKNESASYRVYITFLSSGANCNQTSISRTRKITFSTPERPVLNVTQPSCMSAFGMIEAVIENNNDQYSFDNGLTFQESNIITGLPAGTYNVVVKSAAGCLSEPANCNIFLLDKYWTGFENYDWFNPKNWSPAGVPDETNCINIASSENDAEVVGSNVTVCARSITVYANASLTIHSSNTLKLLENVVVDPNGTLILEDNSSLVQASGEPNFGEIIYKRKTANISKMDYTYWSSPVSDFAIGQVSPNTMQDKLFSFNSMLDDWQQEAPTNLMKPGIGYIIRGPQNFALPKQQSKYEATFVGKPNNGYFELDNLITDRFHLIGNPYPSALDASTFIVANKSVLEGTVYFWTHNTPIAIGTPNPGSGVWAYTGNDYAAFNMTGGVATSSSSKIPNGKIASAQGFFTKVKPDPSSVKIFFDNSMRVGNAGNLGDNSQFFRTNKSTNKARNPRIWLNLTNDEGAFKQLLIGYIQNASNNFEYLYDGESINGNAFLDFYSIVNDKKLTIQGRANNFDSDDEVPLGFRVAEPGNYKIQIGLKEDFFDNTKIFLKDNLTNKLVDLSVTEYNFSSLAGTFDARFKLLYKDNLLNINTESTLDKIDFFYSNTNKDIEIISNLEEVTSISIHLFNSSGQEVLRVIKSISEHAICKIPLKNLEIGFYIVNIITDKGMLTKKIQIN